ncbi:DMT family transporter [Schumannella sp. 10F1B-5-1]|uniref:DMT family transporter n=1 Tax=Schumannella sp. 10F1B-5-1 TaxID=2590780 RepID=UPI00113018AD|nr:DMT family transporter [Schumannella sp. 10F1B-5-1]TPW72276.1 DMT family transporter [Schumannella sp. 10F1B-5-1]
MTTLRGALRAQSPDLVLLGIAVVWGGSYLASKDLAAASSAAAVMCARFVPAAVLLLGLCAARRAGALGGAGRASTGRRGAAPGALRRSLRAGVTLGALRAATIALETVGVTLTSAANAGLLIGLSVLITPLIEAARLRRPLSRGLIGSILLAVVGVGLLVSGGGLTAPNPGDALILCAAVTRAGLGVAEGRTAAQPGSDVIALTTVELSVGAVAFAIVGGGPLLAAIGGFGPAQWAGIAYLVLGCTIAAFLGTLWATRRTSASRAGILLGTEPIWALGIAVVLAGERIGVPGLIGAVVLIGATLWGRRAERLWRERALPIADTAPDAGDDALPEPAPRVRPDLG